MGRFSLILTALVLATSVNARAATRTFYVNDPLQRDLVSFKLHGPLQTVEGRTASVKGYVEVDPNHIRSASRARFEVDLASLKTGIGLRDKHMRDKYLETDKYPQAVFELTRVVDTDSNDLVDQKPINLTLEGNLTIHGVSKTVQIPVTVTYFGESESTKSKLPGDLLRIQGRWEILLSDYNISRPKFVVIKLDDKVQAEIDLFAATGLQAVPVADKATTK